MPAQGPAHSRRAGTTLDTAAVNGLAAGRAVGCCTESGRSGAAPLAASVDPQRGDRNALAPANAPRLRTALRRLLVGSLALLVLLGAGHFSAAAATNRLAQHAFVKYCKHTGGSSTRVSTDVITCTYPDGQTTTCDFSAYVIKCTASDNQPTTREFVGSGDHRGGRRSSGVHAATQPKGHQPDEPDAAPPGKHRPK